MPELPDILVYVGALRSRVVGQRVARIEILSPFLLRTVDPPIDAVERKEVLEVRRAGKRLVFALADDLFLVVHLMIAGRLLWTNTSSRRPGRIVQAIIAFPTGQLVLTEAGKKKRASLHLVRGALGVAAHDPGGVDVLQCDRAGFRQALLSGNHTLKRALTDPRSFDGIGNAYSDEILHAARLSPIRLTSKLSEREIGQLFEATRKTLADWIDTLRCRFADRFPGPGEITAFREEFAVHGRFGKPCRVCGASVQRIRYADRETNYCPTCQTDGKVLADRSLSRLLKGDWPPP